jgi:hypothetical protein
MPLRDGTQNRPFARPLGRDQANYAARLVIQSVSALIAESVPVSGALQAGLGIAQIGLFGTVGQRAPRPWLRLRLRLSDRQQPADRARRGYNSVAIWGSLTGLRQVSVRRACDLQRLMPADHRGLLARLGRQ